MWHFPSYECRNTTWPLILQDSLLLFIWFFFLNSSHQTFPLFLLSAILVILTGNQSLSSAGKCGAWLQIIETTRWLSKQTKLRVGICVGATDVAAWHSFRWNVRTNFSADCKNVTPSKHKCSFFNLIFYNICQCTFTMFMIVIHNMFMIEVFFSCWAMRSYANHMVFFHFRQHELATLVSKLVSYLA